MIPYAIDNGVVLPIRVFMVNPVTKIELAPITIRQGDISALVLRHDLDIRSGELIDEPC